jgi:hypothetical protein
MIFHGITARGYTWSTRYCSWAKYLSDLHSFECFENLLVNILQNSVTGQLVWSIVLPWFDRIDRLLFQLVILQHFNLSKQAYSLFVFIHEFL